MAASRYNYGPIDTPAPKPVPRFEPMEKPRAVRVQTEAPTASSMGAVEWFDYTIRPRRKAHSHRSPRHERRFDLRDPRERDRVL